MSQITAEYNDAGDIVRLLIYYKGETIEIVTRKGNTPNRELQRADEVVRSLLKSAGEL